MRRNSLLYAGTLAFGQLATAAAFALAARHTSPTTFGVLASGIAIGAVLAGLLDFGQSNYLIREVAKGGLLRREATDRLIVKLAAGLLGSCAAVAAALVFTNGGHNVLTIVLAGTITLMGALTVQALQVELRARGRFFSVSVCSVLGRMSLVSVVTLGVLLGAQGHKALLAGLLTSGAVEAFSLFIARRPGPYTGVTARIRALPMRDAWGGSTAYGVSGLASAAQQLDVVVLAAFGGTGAAGVYAAVARWTSPLILPSSAITQVATPTCAAAVNVKSGLAQLRPFWILIVASAAPCLVLAAFSDRFTELLLGPAFAQSASVLALLAVGVIPTIFAQPVNMLLQVQNRDASIAVWSTIATLIRLAGAGTLGAFLGANGGAISVILQQVVLCVAIGFILRSAIRRGGEA
ncbi:lipopolysaccharide biosynthesis protein [Klenkia terrae]|uniref:Oligosaccharide flippase family protein n=1 Tax=Klenkia terrae TaxID=1052259 RepID=A0ABU8E3S2_9ACTN|nr:oligosaccharide flippase family protein [Klenkia terrae]SSC24154.1 Polysaccharide biosynthesis protein [Klenkia terrae]